MIREAIRSLFFVYVHGAKSIQSLVSGLILAALLCTVVNLLDQCTHESAL